MTGPRTGVWYAALASILILGGFVTGALPGPPLSKQGELLVSTYDPQTVADYVFRSPVHLVVLALVVAAAVGVARGADPGEVTRLGERARAHERLVVAVLALGAGAFSLHVALGPLQGVAHVQDERAYLFQARLFADSRMAAPVPAPPLDRALALDFTVQRGGRWFGRFPPGWPAVLAAGVGAGAPWAVNPLLTVLVVVGLHLFVRRRMDAGAALAVTALCAASPLVTLVGASMMSHPFALVLLLIVLAAWERALDGSDAAGLVLGAAAGVYLMTRPQEAVLAGVVAVLHLASWRRWRAAAGAGVVGAAFAGVNLWYNLAQTGDAWLPPTLAFYAGDRPGFFAQAGVYVAEGHNLARGLHNLVAQFRVTSDVLFGWPFVSLVPALVGLCTYDARGDAKRVSYERALAALAASYVAFLVTYHNPGFAFGSRLHYPLLPAFALFTSQGLAWLCKSLDGRGATAVCAVAFYLSMLAVTTHYPRRIADLNGYWGVRPIANLLQERNPATLALVVPGQPDDPAGDAFASFEAASTPWPGARGVVAARDGHDVEAALRIGFPDRTVVILPGRFIVEPGRE